MKNHVSKSKVERKENLEVVVSISSNGDEWKKYTKKEDYTYLI